MVLKKPIQLLVLFFSLCNLSQGKEITGQIKALVLLGTIGLCGEMMLMQFSRFLCPV
jgi:hypothetical protein